MEDPRILMAGCGSLGQRIGLALAENCHVFGMRRQVHRIPLPLTPVQADLNDPEQLRRNLPSVDIAIVCITPDQYDQDHYVRTFVQGLGNLLDTLERQEKPPQRVFFVSSTAVYGQHQDEWVDETSETQPQRYNGQALVQAEQRLHASSLPGTAIRLSGIYGHSRNSLLDRIINGEMAPNPASGYTNRIHEDDAVSVFHHLVMKELHGATLSECYLASDCEPARLGDIVSWVRETIDCAPLKPDARQDTRAGSKRCANKRLLDTGYQFLFPTFREGYGGILSEWRR